jgi:hypothetical protein
MERTLDTVLKSIGNPSMASGMISRSPSPAAQTAQTQALLQSPSPTPQPSYPAQSATLPPSSPKLHCLPENSLTPLGLLVEASLAKRKVNGVTASFTARPTDADSDRRLGVASDNYFKPGLTSLYTMLCHAAHFLVRSDVHLAAQAAVHREADTARNAELREHRRGGCVV